MYKPFLFFAVFVFIFSSCKKEQGTAGLNSLVNIVPLSAGTDCPAGGLKIETGLDINNNKVLDPTEVTNSQNLCNGTSGANGHNSLIKSSILTSTDICQSGGLQIQSGIDINDDGILQDSEVQQTQIVCNGASGIYDKQIAIVIGYGFASNQTSPYIYQGLPVKFNIANFPGVDSAVFVVRNAATTNGASNINFKLYDLTDNVAFDSSLVFTNSIFNTLLQSPNIVKSFPNKEIDLGLELYTDVNNINGSASTFYLLLYRK